MWKNAILCLFHYLEQKNFQPMGCSDGTFLISIVSEPDYDDAVSGSG